MQLRNKVTFKNVFIRGKSLKELLGDTAIYDVDLAEHQKTLDDVNTWFARADWDVTDEEEHGNAKEAYCIFLDSITDELEDAIRYAESRSVP